MADTPAAAITGDELRAEVRKELRRHGYSPFDGIDWITAQAACALGYRKGRAEEREACAQLAEQHNAQCSHADDSGGDFADLIRTREG